MTQQSYVFIAGGMGITPFRSIIASSIKTNTQLQLMLMHFVTKTEDLLFSELFEEAEEKIGIVYYPFVSIRFSERLLRNTISTVTDHSYYLSGSEQFINAVREVLQNAGISDEQIKTDIFSGY